MNLYFSHSGHGSLLKLRQFHLPQFASVFSATNEYQHCWDGTFDGLASCPGESVQLHSKLLALNETRFKHWPSLAFIAYLRHTVWGGGEVAFILYFSRSLGPSILECFLPVSFFVFSSTRLICILVVRTRFEGRLSF